MMILTKDRPKTEIEKFMEFVKDKRHYSVGANGKGEITEVKTENQEIIAWLKEKGFKE